MSLRAERGNLLLGLQHGSCLSLVTYGLSLSPSSLTTRLPHRSAESPFTPCRRGPTMKQWTGNEGALADSEERVVPGVEVPAGRK